MPELQEPLPGDEVDATWGEQVSNRVVSRYASIVQRDAGGPFEEGTPCYVLDVDEFQVYDGAAWIVYVDQAELNAGLGLYLPLAGGSMSGGVSFDGSQYDIAPVDDSFTITPAATIVDVPGVNISIPEAGTWLLWASCYVENSINQDTEYLYQMTLGNNAEIGATRTESYGTVETGNKHSMAIATARVFGGADNVKMRAWYSPAGGVHILRKCTLTGLRVA